MRTLRERLADLRRDGRWIPFAFAGFFVVVFAANGIMVALATSSWPGLVDDDAYRAGLAYNRNLEAARAQAALGWQADLAVAPSGARRLRLTLALADAEGRALPVDQAQADFYRPSSAAADFTRPLEPRGTGRYGTEVAVPLSGVWDVTVSLRRGDDRYQLRRRVVVAP